MARYTGSTNYADIAQVDLVIEAVFEDIEVKKAVFRELDRVCKPGAVLATNTSYLDIDAIAACHQPPAGRDRPALLQPRQHHEAAGDRGARQGGGRRGGHGVRAGQEAQEGARARRVCDGFIGNRILAVYKQAADYLMEDGASPTKSTPPCAALVLPWARSR